MYVVCEIYILRYSSFLKDENNVRSLNYIRINYVENA